MNSSLLSHPGLITGFVIIILIMLILDLGVLNKKSHVVSNKEALVWSLVWISLAMIFSGVIYWVFLQDSKALALDKFSQFQSAYWIEKALSVDNLFVFILVFNFFKVPKLYQHRVLFWGVIGALVFRAIFIFVGVSLINKTFLPAFSIGDLQFVLDPRDKDVHSNLAEGLLLRPNAILTIFGVFLVVAGIKSWFAKDKEEELEKEDLNNSFGARLVRRFFKVSKTFDGDHFFTVKDGIKMATPLFTCLVIIELTDLVFAVDSIPAIFSIAPDDPFILYTSNIFAILGLRSLYFLLANFMNMFSKLKYGLAVILTFIGVKMLIAPAVHISSPVSLGIVGSVLLISLVVSLIWPAPKKEAH